MPHVKMSAAGPIGCPLICSGAIQPAEPNPQDVGLAREPWATAWAIPKSITRGPDSDSSTLLGLRSRCTSPARWMAVSAVATPTASPVSVDGVSGPPRAIAWSRRRPSMNSVTR
jgi:hypothetical protein